MRIAMLLSGGVDSSVALRLLQQQGHDVTAFYLKIWLEDELSYLGSCPWEEDLAYVRAVTTQARIPCEVVPFQREYWQTVVDYTIAEVKMGRTPNPDIMCNKHIKFGAFLTAFGSSFEKIATGHYGKVIAGVHSHELHRSPDPIKDQTYFLSSITMHQLSSALFPIGHLFKEEVRAKAIEFDLPNKDRKDSQGICFLGKLKFSDFIRHHLGIHKGALVEVESGIIVGEHDGFWYYTLGQRKAIGLSGGPWYVVAKDTQANIVYISKSYYAAEKERSFFLVEHVNWLAPQPEIPLQLGVKLRHGPKIASCVVTPLSDNRYQVSLEERDQGIAPGQFAVFYEGTRCLGGGVISERP